MPLFLNMGGHLVFLIVALMVDLMMLLAKVGTEYFADLIPASHSFMLPGYGRRLFVDVGM